MDEIKSVADFLRKKKLKKLKELQEKKRMKKEQRTKQKKDFLREYDQLRQDLEQLRKKL